MISIISNFVIGDSEMTIALRLIQILCRIEIHLS